MRRTYITAQRLAELHRTLSARDWLLLATVARVRLATTRQLERVCFTDTTRRRARGVLASLTDRQVLARLPRVIGGVRAGSSGFVYSVGIAGQRLLRLTGIRRSQRPWNVGTGFLTHSLAVTELYVRLVESERAGQLELCDFASEPASWRTFAGPGGGHVVLKPDAIVTTRLGRFEDRWFIEVDLGTESAPTVARKCDTYRRYWQTGTEQARHEVFPKVLWLVRDAHRHTTLVDVCGRQPTEAWPLFTVAQFDDAIGRIAQGAHL
jgi:hypothetical protein